MASNLQRKLVFVGGGHSHVQVLKAFAADPPANCDITIVAKEAVAMYSGMAPGFVAGQYERAELEIDVRPLAHACGAEPIIDAVSSVDPVANVMYLANHDPVPFDVASLNLGSTVVGLDLPGVREHALSTRPLSGLVDAIKGLIDRARAHSDSNPFHIAVIGAGVAGVELAFTSQARLQRETGKEIVITLVDAGDRILNRQSDSLRRRVLRRTEQRGIEVRHGVRVAAVSAEGVQFEHGDSLETDAVIWATGPTSHGVFRNSPNVTTCDRGFARIRDTLQLEHHDHVFAVGDCATLVDHPDTPKAGVYAVREGPVVTHNLRAYLAGESLIEYTPQGDFLMLLNAGDGTAIGTKWGFSFEGRWVMRWKDHIDKAFMREYQM